MRERRGIRKDQLCTAAAEDSVYSTLTLSVFFFPSTAEGLTRKHMSDVSGWQTFSQALGYFLKMFFGSAALGTLTGLISALISF